MGKLLSVLLLVEVVEDGVEVCVLMIVMDVIECKWVEV